MRDDLEAWLSTRELLENASVSQLMHRLFAAEMSAQRAQIRERLQAAPDPFGESGLTLVAPLLGAVPSTVSGLRATQTSTVSDLMAELTRQRRTTTRLLGGLLAVVGVAALVGLYLLASAPRGAPVAAPQTTAVAARAPTLAGPPPLVTAAASQAPTAPASRTTNVVARPATPASLAAVQRRVQRTVSQPASESPTPPSAEPSPVRETGLLNLDTSPWSVVSASGRVLGQTPIVGAVLPVGTHVLVLSNPELGLKTTYQVTITAGRTTARRVGLE
jgi:hypothetical protein